MFRRRICANARLVGLHDINNKDDVRQRGNMKIEAGQPLVLNRDPRLFHEHDPHAVNVIAANGNWAGSLFGHVTIAYTDPTRNLNWAHYISALMDGDDSRLPPQLSGLQGKIRVEGETIDMTTHRPDGSKIAVFILFQVDENEELVTAVRDYLEASRMVVTRM